METDTLDHDFVTDDLVALAKTMSPIESLVFDLQQGGVRSRALLKRGADARPGST